ncbi:CDP-glycerol glycerophosphotransferase family protein [Glutamicibacter endophyticus]|uniref:CDP-glycerol glycerophosphotransferase family protein n=1 Tax=Glutamicibacter endophyticus TaxID=1522174 RepID=UPI003AF08124
MENLKHSVRTGVQKLVERRNNNRLEKRNYRYYRGYYTLNISQHELGYDLRATVGHPVAAVSVLHGRHIVTEIPALSTESGEHHQVTAQLYADPLLFAWADYRERVSDELESPEVSDEDEATDEASNDEVDPRHASGTVRLALRFTAPARDLPRGIAWVQLEADGPLLRRNELTELLESDDAEVPEHVIVHRILGRFESTHIGELSELVSDSGSVAMYVNKQFEIAIAVNRPLGHKHRIRTDAISVTNGVLHLSGELDAKSDVLSGARLIIRGRKSAEEFVAATELHFSPELSARRFGLNLYKWSLDFDFRAVDWSTIDSGDNFDLYLEVEGATLNEPLRWRISRTPYLVRSTTAGGSVTEGDQTLVISPYYTFKAKATSLLLEVFDADAYTVLEESTARTFPALQPGEEPVWLVGELPYKAQDNGLHLFRYLRSHRPDIEAYYVIDRQSPDLRNFENLDHVVFHGSKEHFELALRATRIIGTHHADFLYPTRYSAFSARSRATRVFLQHGVMGTKWMVPNYGKNSPGFATDLFCVSSDREKQYIVNDFQYPESEVKVTGLPRFDALLDGQTPLHSKMLLIIPTWRDWLQTEEAFLESDYLQRWRELLSSPQLAELARDHDLEIVFSLHPNMQHFRDHFADAPARLIVQGEVDVQQLIKQAGIMITDYSSVAFDFSFLHKPVHYYQFDRARFLGRNGSHLDLDAELPGRIAFDAEHLLGDLQDTLERGRSMEEEYVRRADVFMKHRDRHNAERVVAEIEAASLRTSGDDTWRAELPEKLMRRFRKHKYYYTAMRAMFRAVQATKADENIIVFESGLGKQYGDSPRYIYEELVRRGDTRTKVWIYSGSHRFTDPNTRVVKRLSPEYYWYLAKAKYWVSNQSMPYYLRRRKNGIFLQTWHGTPLKHMLLDIEEIHGRDEGYVQRVLQATSQWSHLISPSPYATDAMRSSYAYTGEAVELGYPRNDILMSEQAEEHERRVRESLGLAPEVRTVLYAPTFRDDAGNGKGRFRFELPFDLAQFNERFGRDTVLLLRMHVLVANAISIPEELAERVIDVSAYPDIQELYLAADVLVTDYSSVFFDYSILKRPIIFYAYDLVNYRDNLRGFYLDYDKDLPGPVVQSETELWQCVGKALAGEPLAGVDREEFVARFAPYDDGHASRRVVDRFFGDAR